MKTMFTGLTVRSVSRMCVLVILHVQDLLGISAIRRGERLIQSTENIFGRIGRRVLNDI